MIARQGGQQGRIGPMVEVGMIELGNRTRSRTGVERPEVGCKTLRPWDLGRACAPRIETARSIAHEERVDVQEALVTRFRRGIAVIQVLGQLDSREHERRRRANRRPGSVVIREDDEIEAMLAIPADHFFRRRTAVARARGVNVELSLEVAYRLSHERHLPRCALATGDGMRDEDEEKEAVAWGQIDALDGEG